MTSILRVCKNSIINFMNSYIGLKLKKSNYKEYISIITSKLQVSFDIYDDAIYTDTFISSSDKEINNANKSLFIISALLSNVKIVPKDVLITNPSIVEQCISIVVNLNENNDIKRPEGKGLVLRPHHGIYSQLIIIAGKASMYNISKSLYNNLCNDSDLGTNEVVLNSLLTAAGYCNEYTEAKSIFDNEFSSSGNSNSNSKEGNVNQIDIEDDRMGDTDRTRPLLTQAVVTKYMEICRKGKYISEGIDAFNRWHSGGVSGNGNGNGNGNGFKREEPDWYCLSVLSELCTMHPDLQNDSHLHENENENNNEDDSEIKQQPWLNDPVYKSIAIRNKQIAAMNVVSDSVILALRGPKITMKMNLNEKNNSSNSNSNSSNPNIYSPIVNNSAFDYGRFLERGSNNHSMVPLAILCSPIGAYMASIGYTEQILMSLHRHLDEHQHQGDNNNNINNNDIDTKIKLPFWNAIIKNLANWNQWRLLQSLTERMLIHHRSTGTQGVIDMGMSTGMGINPNSNDDCPTSIKIELLGTVASLAHLSGTSTNSNSIINKNKNLTSATAVIETEKPANFREGDWMCNLCGTHNFGDKETCYGCKASRHALKSMSTDSSTNTDADIDADPGVKGTGIDGTRRAEDLLTMYIPAIVNELHHTAANANANAGKAGTGSMDRNVMNFWHLFHTLAMKREFTEPGMAASNASLSNNDNNDDKDRGSLVGNSGYHTYQVPDGRIVPYHLCKYSANTIPTALAVILRELSLLDNGNGNGNGNLGCFVSILHDALSHCYNAKQALQCIHVFCEYIEGKEEKEKEMKSQSLPLSSKQESLILKSMQAAVDRTNTDANANANATQAPEVAAIFDMLENRLMCKTIQQQQQQH